MEISAEKTEPMTNNTSGIDTEIKVNGQRLETVTGFKYLGSVITDKDSKPEMLSRIAQTTAVLTRSKPVWKDGSISLSSKIRLTRSFVISIFLCACESRTLTAELQRRIPAMEMRCYRKVLRISYKYHVTARVVGAPHMISQPDISVFPVLHCPPGLGELQACPFPDVVFPPLPLFAVSSSPLSLCLARWFWPDLMNGKHDHTTAVCV